MDKQKSSQTTPSFSGGFSSISPICAGFYLLLNLMGVSEAGLLLIVASVFSPFCLISGIVFFLNGGTHSSNSTFLRVFIFTLLNAVFIAVIAYKFGSINIGGALYPMGPH